MKAYVYRTSTYDYKGEIVESENLETLCRSLLKPEMFDGKEDLLRLVIMPPEEDCTEYDWLVEIYDDWRE